MDARDIDDNIDKLYPLYIKFINMFRIQFSRLLPAGKSRRYFTSNINVLTLDQFSNKIRSIVVERPHDFKKLECLLTRPHQAASRERRRWESILYEAGLSLY